jgi:uncharacterized protein YabN with tetrapyrrole methylase and pyrophosphatase domain
MTGLEQGASLTVVGLGIQVPAHVTGETRACLERADAVLHLLADPVAALWIESINPSARSLDSFYEPGRERSRTYAAIVDEVLARLREGGEVCLAFYGHPGVFATPAHEAVRRARSEGFAARMLPAVSAEDCLFADLGIDPGASGCQSFDATDVLVRRRQIDPSAGLILWQAAIVGNSEYAPAGDPSRLPQLVEYLEQFYPADHEVVSYAASPYPIAEPIIQRLRLAELAQVELPRLSLLYLPPAVGQTPDFSMLEPTLQAEARETAVPSRT